MKNKHLVMLLLSSCCLAACVDSKYDLSDVNTDDAVMGESWVAPLGTGYVTSDDVVNVEKVPSIREVDGAYVMIYDGEMKIKGKSLRAASDKVEIASEDITTGDRWLVRWRFRFGVNEPPHYVKVECKECLFGL